MRALFLKDKIFNEEELLEITGDPAKHLIKAIRVKKGCKLLLLNGNGLTAEATITEIEKKTLTLEIEKVTNLTKSFELDLCICPPKKEAFELIIRNAVEIGFSKIFPVTSEFSQLVYEESSRMDNIVESALIQSNNAFYPIIENQVKFEDLTRILDDYEQVIYFCSRSKRGESTSIIRGKTLMIVGPEGGLSFSEEQYLQESVKSLKMIHLPTNILRAPNAISVGAGVILGKFI